MATEKRLIPFGEKVTLYDLPFGAMFAFGDDCIALKSEYVLGNGLIEAHIIDSGEQFWGGAKTAKEQNELMVQPLEIVDAVEVVHGRWQFDEDTERHRCSVCGKYAINYPYLDEEKRQYTYTVEVLTDYCYDCGADMRGGEE